MPWIKFPMPGWLTAWELARHCNWRNAKTAAGIKDALHGGRLTSTAEHAALLRCSMDLTRALANMRRRK